MAFDNTNTPPTSRLPADLQAYLDRCLATATKRSQLGAMFDEREADNAETWAPRRNLLEG